MTIINEDMKKALEGMSLDDMKKMLISDPLYQEVIKHAPVQDREKIETIALDFITGWKENAFDKIIALASNPEFVKELMRVMSARDPGSKLGDIL